MEARARLLTDFELLKADIPAAAAAFYHHLFCLAPGLREHFREVDMEAQGQMVFQAIGLAVNGLERIDQLRPVLENLGYRHAGYGVRAEHYGFATEALVATLRERIGDDFSPPSEVAWRRALTLITGLMLEGVESVGRQIEQARSEQGGPRFASPESGGDEYLGRFLDIQEDGPGVATAPEFAGQAAQAFEVVYEGERKVEAAPLQTFLQISLQNGIPHLCECGGKAKCTTCRVVVVEGLEHCLPRNQAEMRMARFKGFSPEVRLGCQTRVSGPVKVRRLVLDELDASEAAQSGRSSIGREMDLAVMFADVRGFTDMSSRNLPHDIVHALNRYFRVVCEEIDRHRGYIDKYIGDGLMALFGLSTRAREDACRDAVEAAVAMQRSMVEVNAYLRDHLGMEFSIGIGIHHGPMVVGELGSRLKRQFTAVGDVVNTAARIEGKSKELGAGILVSEVVRKVLPEDDFDFGPPTPVTLAGKEGELAVCEVRVSR